MLVLLHMLSGDSGPYKDTEDSWKHCLIMDEVDGMAGNEDRGGIQVLQLYQQSNNVTVHLIAVEFGIVTE